MTDPIREPGGASEPKQRLQNGVNETARWTWRVLVLILGLVVVGWVLGQTWTIVLPLVLAFLLASVLWAPTRFLRRWLPPALAAAIVVVGSLAIVLGLIAVLVPLVSSDIDKLAEQGSAGLDSLRDLLSKPPFNLSPDDLGGWIDKGIKALQDNAEAIAGQVGTVLGSLSSAVITLVLALVLTFFMMKDGPKFLAWVTGWIGRPAGRHASELSTRVFDQLGSFLWSQAAVSLVDAVFIGLGLWILGVPLVLPLAIVTFFGGFIPIIGAFATGILAVLVALVSEGVGTALWVVLIVVLVQQLEGNVLSPFLVGKAMELHPGVVLGVITVGGSLAGITGAFLAVPLTATLVVTLKYIREQLRPQLVLPSGIDPPPDVPKQEPTAP